MLSLNEQSETRLWINGIHTAILRTGPSIQANLCLVSHGVDCILTLVPFSSSCSFLMIKGMVIWPLLEMVDVAILQLSKII